MVEKWDPVLELRDPWDPRKLWGPWDPRVPWDPMNPWDSQDLWYFRPPGTSGPQDPWEITSIL